MILLLFVVLAILFSLFSVVFFQKNDTETMIYIEDEKTEVRNDGRVTLYERYDTLDTSCIDTNSKRIHRSFHSRNVISNSDNPVSVFIFPNHNKPFLKTRYEMNHEYEYSTLHFNKDDTTKEVPLIFIEITISNGSLLHIPKHTFIAIEEPTDAIVFKS